MPITVLVNQVELRCFTTIRARRGGGISLETVDEHRGGFAGPDCALDVKEMLGIADAELYRDKQSKKKER